MPESPPMELPPMPYTTDIRKLDRDEWAYSNDQDFANPEKYGWERVFTADQMRAYAEAAVLQARAAERERCAKLVESLDCVYQTNVAAAIRGT